MSRTSRAVAPKPATSVVVKQLFLVYLMLCGALFVALFRQYLPDKYSYDTAKIRRLALGLQETQNDPSYQNTGDLYGALGLGSFPVLAGLLGYLCSCALLIRFVAAANVSKLEIGSTVLYAGAVVVGSVYLGTYTKEIVVLLISAVVLVSRPGLRWDATVVAFMCGYAMFFRSYWFLIAIAYVGLLTLTRYRMTTLRVAAYMTVALLVLAIAFPVFVGEDLNSFREQVNLDRTDSVDAVSAITPPLDSSGTLGSWVNAVVVLVYLVAPLDLALRGSIFYIAAAGFVGFAWATLWREVYRGTVLEIRNSSQEETRRYRICLLLASVVTIQAVFEPDYGSYLRHLAPLLPLFVYLSFSSRSRSNAQTLSAPLARVQRLNRSLRASRMISL